MLIYIPYGTDAPVYHRPIITMMLIALNIGVFVMFTQEQIEPFKLTMGQGLHPVQWLTTNFLHSDPVHLIFNMLFLWVFGPVVEGRVGIIKMSAIFFGIAILFGAIVQVLTLRYEPGNCSGASGVIYGLAAMSFIWAPESKVHGIIVFWIIFRAFVKDLETEISLVVGFFAVLSVTWSLIFGNGLIGELGHIAGAILGLAVAVGMLKWKYVHCDCEDIFSVWSGAKERVGMESEQDDVIQRRKERREEQEKRKNLLSEGIESAILNKTPLPAFIIAQRKEREFTDWTLPQELHWKLIQQLLAGKHWTEANVSMQQYLERHQEQSVFVRMMLAQAFLSQSKPKSAMDILDSIPLQEASVEQRSAIPKIRKKAESMFQKNIVEGIYEVSE